MTSGVYKRIKSCSGEKNNFFSRHHTEETRRRISEAKKNRVGTMLGKHHSEETKRKMSIAKKGKFTWIINKNHPKYAGWLSQVSLPKSEKTKLKMKEHIKSVEHRKHISEAKKGIPLSDITKRKLSEANKGKHLSEETRKKISESQRGEKCHWWLGGISFEPYGLEFNRILKDSIRCRDKYSCQVCNKNQIENFTKLGMSKKLYVHHIDYNKKNNKHENLISLCLNCHSKTNFMRDDWTNHFMEKMSHVCSI